MSKEQRTMNNEQRISSKDSLRAMSKEQRTMNNEQRISSKDSLRAMNNEQRISSKDSLLSRMANLHLESFPLFSIPSSPGPFLEALFRPFPGPYLFPNLIFSSFS